MQALLWPQTGLDLWGSLGRWLCVGMEFVVRGGFFVGARWFDFGRFDGREGFDVCVAAVGARKGFGLFDACEDHRRRRNVRSVATILLGNLFVEQKRRQLHQYRIRRIRATPSYNIQQPLDACAKECKIPVYGMVEV